MKLETLIIKLVRIMETHGEDVEVKLRDDEFWGPQEIKRVSFDVYHDYVILDSMD